MDWSGTVLFLQVAIDVVYENRSIRRTFYVEEIAKRVYKV